MTRLPQMPDMEILKSTGCTLYGHVFIWTSNHTTIAPSDPDQRCQCGLWRWADAVAGPEPVKELTS